MRAVRARAFRRFSQEESWNLIGKPAAGTPTIDSAYAQMALASLALLSCSFAPTLLSRPAPSGASRRAGGAALVMVTKDAPLGLRETPTEEEVTPWQLTAEGLKFVDERVGTGAVVSPDSVVSVHYTVSFAVRPYDVLGTSNKWPLTFAHSKHNVPLFSDAVQGMRVGGKRRLVVPAANIPPSQMRNVPKDNYADGVRLEIELVAIETGAKALVASLLPPGDRRLTIARFLFALSFVPYLLPAELLPGWLAAQYQWGDPALIAQAHQASRMLGGASIDFQALGL